MLLAKSLGFDKRMCQPPAYWRTSRPALGKKNWLFRAEAEAGQRITIVYTLIESCRRLDIDPFTHLRDVLTRIVMSIKFFHRRQGDLTDAVKTFF